MKNSKIKFVQLEPGAFLTDPDFIKMTPAQRGIYISLILALYCNNGQLKLDKNIGKIRGCSQKIFLSLFSKISHKFRIKNGKIFHKKVSKVIAHQKKLMQIAKESGLKGAKVTWGAHGNENENEKGNETKTKNVSNNISNSNISDCLNSKKDSTAQDSSNTNSSISTKNLIRPSNSLRKRIDNQIKTMDELNFTNDTVSNSRINVTAVRFIDSLGKYLFAKTRSDRSCFLNVSRFLADGCREGKFNLEIFDRALSYAKEAKSGENPNALFMSLMRSQLGYERNLK